MEKSKIGRTFQGKVAIVTASTQGIGFGIAERLGLEGASVVISSRKQIVEEAGGKVTCMDGGNFSVFDISILVSNCVLHGKLLERVAPATEKLKSKGIDFSLWYKPEYYTRDI